jgi:hypothetical protein
MIRFLLIALSMVLLVSSADARGGRAARRTGGGCGMAMTASCGNGHMMMTAGCTTCGTMTRSQFQAHQMTTVRTMYTRTAGCGTGGCATGGCGAGRRARR